MACGVGPIQISPASMTAWANSAFSARNPYPGWTASAPDRRRDVDELVDAQVGLGRGVAAEGVRLVGQPRVQGVAVGVGVDGHAAEAGVAAGPDDADRDLAPVGDQNLAHVATSYRSNVRSRLRSAICSRRSGSAARLVNVGYYDRGMSTTRLMILGLVQLDAAGARVRRAARAGELAAPTSGPTSRPVRSTTRCASSPTEGLLEEVATEQVGGRPARTTYRITPKGDGRVRGAAAPVLVGVRAADRPVPGRLRIPAGAAAGGGRRRAAQPGPAAAGQRRHAPVRPGQRVDAPVEAGPRRRGCSSCTWSGSRPRSPGASGSPARIEAGEMLFPDGMPRWPGTRPSPYEPVATAEPVDAVDRRSRDKT